MSQGPASSVLITGAAGLIGGILTRELGDEYRVSGLDARKIGPLRVGRRNMARLRSVQDSFVGQDFVIDLAAEASVGSSWRSVYRNNLAATYTAFEAARRASVRRVVFASSNHVTGGYEREPPYSAIVSGAYDHVDPQRIPLLGAEAPIRPDSLYGVGKAFGEAIGRYYADEFGLSVICLRIGTVNAPDRPTKPRHFATFLSHRDLVQLVRCSLAAPAELRYGVFYGVSGNRWRFWDIESARNVLGYIPADDAEDWRSPGGVTGAGENDAS